MNLLLSSLNRTARGHNIVSRSQRAWISLQLLYRMSKSDKRNKSHERKPAVEITVSDELHFGPFSTVISTAHLAAVLAFIINCTVVEPQ